MALKDKRYPIRKKEAEDRYKLNGWAVIACNGARLSTNVRWKTIASFGLSPQVKSDYQQKTNQKLLTT